MKGKLRDEKTEGRSYQCLQIPRGQVSRAWGQALSDGARQQDNGQQTEIET